MRFIVCAGSEGEARAWGRAHGVRPCDVVLVVPADTVDAVLGPLRSHALTRPLQHDPVVRLPGWLGWRSKPVRAAVDGFLLHMRPPSSPGPVI